MQKRDLLPVGLPGETLDAGNFRIGTDETQFPIDGKHRGIVFMVLGLHTDDTACFGFLKTPHLQRRRDTTSAPVRMGSGEIPLQPRDDSHILACDRR